MIATFTTNERTVRTPTTRAIRAITAGYANKLETIPPLAWLHAGRDKSTGTAP